MRENLAELWRYRDLLRQLVARELKVRYKNSALGFLWSVVPVVLELIIYTFLMRVVLGIQLKNYGAIVLCGLIPWTFLQNAVLDSSNSLRLNIEIIKKVYMPREVIPLSMVISNFIHFLLGWVVFFGGYAVVARLLGIGIPLLPSMLWFPVITAVDLLLVAGLSVWVCALCVFYEDVKYIVQALFRLLLFVFPIMYPAERLTAKPFVVQHPILYYVYMLNPVTAIINAYRRTLLQGGPPMDWGTFAGATVISLLIAWGGYAYFNHRKWEFVERQ